MMAMMTKEAAILGRVFHPAKRAMSPEAARELLKLGFTERDHERMAALSAEAQTGQLTRAERDELDTYINISHFLAAMQSTARTALKRPPGTSAA
jgi:hypothetical protein